MSECDPTGCLKAPG